MVEVGLETVRTWGYLVLFVGAFLEAIPFLGLVVPGSVILILAGVLASQGPLELPTVIVVGIAGGLLGQAAGYYAGRYVGRPLLARFGPKFRITRVEVERTEALFRKWGIMAVFLGHFSFLTRGLVNLLAGVSRYPQRWFWPVTTVAVVIWTSIYALLGFVFGEAYEAVAERIGAATVLLVIGVVAGVVGYVLTRRILRRRTK